MQWPRPNSQSNDVPTCFTCRKPDHIKALTGKVKSGIFQKIILPKNNIIPIHSVKIYYYTCCKFNNTFKKRQFRTEFNPFRLSWKFLRLGYWLIFHLSERIFKTEFSHRKVSIVDSDTLHIHIWPITLLEGKNKIPLQLYYIVPSTPSLTCLKAV